MKYRADDFLFGVDEFIPGSICQHILKHFSSVQILLSCLECPGMTLTFYKSQQFPRSHITHICPAVIILIS